MQYRDIGRQIARVRLVQFVEHRFKCLVDEVKRFLDLLFGGAHGFALNFLRVKFAVRRDQFQCGRQIVRCEPADIADAFRMLFNERVNSRYDDLQAIQLLRDDNAGDCVVGFADAANGFVAFANQCGQFRIGFRLRFFRFHALRQLAILLIGGVVQNKRLFLGIQMTFREKSAVDHFLQIFGDVVCIAVHGVGQSGDGGKCDAAQLAAISAIPVDPAGDPKTACRQAGETAEAYQRSDGSGCGTGG